MTLRSTAFGFMNGRLADEKDEGEYCGQWAWSRVDNFLQERTYGDIDIKMKCILTSLMS